MFTPKQVREQNSHQEYALDHWQKRALLGMLGMVLLSFLVSNVWAFMWQSSDWLIATILPAVVVDLTNSERDKLATPALQRNPTLDAAAQLKAEHMAAEGYFAHYSPTGVTPWHWFNQVEYTYAHAGENLAVHFTDSRALVQAWMDSPTHRANIASAKFTEIGVGIARGRYEGFDTVFVVQLFGTPAAPVTVASAPAVPDAEEAEVVSPTETESETTELAVEAVAESSSSQTVVAGEQSTESESVATTVQPVAEQPAQEEVAVSTEDSVAVATTEPTTTEAVAQPADESPEPVADTVWVSSVYATSSGLAPLAATSVAGTTSGVGLAAVATQPNRILQWMYAGLSVGVLLAIFWALHVEVRRRRYVQVGYSCGLLMVMLSLWYIHASLTGGALIV